MTDPSEGTEGNEPTGSASAPQTEDQLPEWARTKLAKANDEAAKYRTRARDAEQTARQQVEQEFSEKLEAAENAKQDMEEKLADSQLHQSKLKIAIESEVPGEQISDFADLLQGSTEEELRGHAEKVKGLMGTAAEPKKADPAVDPAQSSGSGAALPLNGDPLMDALNQKLGINQ